MTDMTWRPIETAPTNEPVLIFLPSCGAYRGLLTDFGEGLRWHTTGFEGVEQVLSIFNPAHWMPMPSRPD